MYLIVMNCANNAKYLNMLLYAYKQLQNDKNSGFVKHCFHSSFINWKTAIIRNYYEKLLFRLLLGYFLIKLVLNLPINILYCYKKIKGYK